MSGTALDEEGQLNLLYVFVSSLFLMFAWTLWHGWESSVSGWGVTMRVEQFVDLARTGRYEVPERHAWDSPAARAMLSGHPKKKPKPREPAKHKDAKENSDALARLARPDLCRRFLNLPAFNGGLRVTRPSPRGPSLFFCPTAKAGSTTIDSMINRHFLANTTAKHRVRRSFAVDRHLSSKLSESDKKFLCSKPFVALTTVRNPWDRLISAFIGKVVVHPDKGGGAKGMREHYGIKRACDLHFPQAIRFVAGQKHPNIHFMPESERCKPERLPYDAVARIEDGFESTLSEVSARLGFDKPTLAKHISTTHDCARSSCCKKGPYLEMLNVSSAAERRRKFYNSELRQLVATRFATDIKSWSYTF